MEEKLKISYLQTELEWEDRKANLLKFDQMLKGREGSDLYLLPEMFTTGFTMSPEGLAETMEGETVEWMTGKARELGALFMGSVIILDDGKYYNRLLCAFPDGRLQHYDKRHLFSYAGEDRSFSPGEKLLLVEHKGWKILPLVCYDLRFPVWSRNTQDYHLLLYLANWPAARILAWNQLLSARAIENQCYVAGVNRIGVDGNQTAYPGDSRVVDFSGSVVQQAGHENGLFSVTLYAEPLNTYRERFPFLKDRDQFEVRGKR